MHTQLGVLIGTPPYMAPEQITGQNSVANPTTDTYALGAVLYEFLTLQPACDACFAYDFLQVLQPDRLGEKVKRPQLHRVDGLLDRSRAAEQHHL